MAAWQAVCQHVRGQRGPLLLHGPLGCGKSHGLQCIVGYFALQHQIVDASATHEEVRVALQALANSEARNHALVIEDVEGFPEVLVSKFAAFADAHPKALLVAVCKDPWALPLRKLRGWSRIGLGSPDREALYEVLTRRFPELSVERRLDAAKGCADVQRLDFRQAIIACEHDFVPLRSVITEDDIFTRTRRFLKGADATDYVHHALDDGPSFQFHVGLLHHNMLDWDDVNLTRAARQLETLAIADAVKNEPTKLAAVLQFKGVAPQFKGALPFPKAPPRARPTTAAWETFRVLTEDGDHAQTADVLRKSHLVKVSASSSASKTSSYRPSSKSRSHHSRN